ncbi:NlpBDapX family lipoprotein [Thiorhodococcus drewsii AZ1]|uniref:NlpBDapX family lipoprotein n=1 Tax=Thiorhodococcus drewsii AZ1 TaxID=765913 RepID=G2E762_9GAMM|nr:NlpBDapX family lipoprotein [Thiorhodococcus drewsii AZ1]
MINSNERSLAVRPDSRFVGALAILFLVSLFQGCSTGLKDAVPDQRLVYKKQREATENLEVPPDLTSGTFDDALDIPGSAGAPTTFSEYAGGRAHRRQVASSGDVLPTTQNVELERSGNERWLQVQGSPGQVWPQVVAFWRKQGILLVEQDPAVGIMRTDWLDNRAEIRKDFITRMMSKVVEGVYSTSTRDQYSLRIEEGTKPGTTDIHLSHRGMSEKLVTDAIGDGSRTIWEPSGTDTEKEAEMLRRLMVFLGAPQSAASKVSSSGPASQPSLARLANEGGLPVLIVSQEFRRAWRLTGTALDRAGFAVEDRDQTGGLYYVRYGGEDAAAPMVGEEDKPGFFSRMAFWRKKDKGLDEVRQYQIKVAGNDSESHVTVLDDKGKPANSEAASRILTLLQPRLR